MKGGRLHRLEPPAPQTAAAAPAPTPADDWVDGSWTVDCSCGVTFDDGEEMVSCDECNVWVHTRCARYVRGVHTSFSCHNCKSRRAPSSADEAEVAEILAELPTHRPPPLYGRWAEVPLPARVHVHGLPGGSDASLFRGAPSSPAFSAALWRCAGYVPKRFGFHYCEFASWADDMDGADALFALAREKRKETSEARFHLPLGAVQKMGKNYVRTLSGCSRKADGSQHVGDDGAEREPPPTKAKKRGTSVSAAEADTCEDGCQQKGDLAVPDVMHENKYAKLNMASSDLHMLFEAKKKIGVSLERSGEKKSSEEIPGMLKKDEPKESMRSRNRVPHPKDILNWENIFDDERLEKVWWDRVQEIDELKDSTRVLSTFARTSINEVLKQIVTVSEYHRQLEQLRQQKAELCEQAERWFKSDEKILADSLDYEIAETKKLREEKEDLLKKLQEANSAAHELQNEINKKDVEIGKLHIEVESKTLVVNELTCIGKEKEKSIKKLGIRLVEQAVEIKQLQGLSTRNQEEMKSTKINLQNNISLLNNVLRELGADEVTPLEGTMIAHTSAIGEQVGNLQELITTLMTNQADSIREAVENAVSYVLAKLKAHDHNLDLQAIEADFDCSVAEATQLIAEVKPVSQKVAEEMQIGSPSSE